MYMLMPDGPREGKFVPRTVCYVWEAKETSEDRLDLFLEIHRGLRKKIRAVFRKARRQRRLSVELPVRLVTAEDSSVRTFVSEQGLHDFLLKKMPAQKKDFLQFIKKVERMLDHHLSDLPAAKLEYVLGRHSE